MNKPINKEQAIEIAKQECIRQSKTWAEPIIVSRWFSRYTVISGADRRGAGHVVTEIRRKDGKIISFSAQSM